MIEAIHMNAINEIKSQNLYDHDIHILTKRYLECLEKDPANTNFDITRHGFFVTEAEDLVNYFCLNYGCSDRDAADYKKFFESRVRDVMYYMHK